MKKSGNRTRAADHVYDPARAAFIKATLQRHGAPFREKDHFYYVRCPYHGGKSMGFWIHKSGRKAKCWRCEEGEDWNAYAAKMGFRNAEIETAKSADESGADYIKQALDGGGGALEEDQYAMLPNGMTPWTKDWRRIKGDLLGKLGVFRWYDDVSGYYRILWPITAQGEVVGYQAGRPPGKYWKRDPKYRASKPLPTDEHFLGLDQVGRNIELIVLVEGAYDLFRGWQNDIPTVANLGASSTWSDDKASTLLGLPRLKYVLVAGDMDPDGKRLYQYVRSDLAGSEIIVKRIKLPRNGKPDPETGEQQYHDLGSAPARWVAKFADHVYDDYDWNGRWSLRPFVQRYGKHRFPKRVYRI